MSGNRWKRTRACFLNERLGPSRNRSQRPRGPATSTVKRVVRGALKETTNVVLRPPACGVSLIFVSRGGGGGAYLKVQFFSGITTSSLVALTVTVSNLPRGSSIAP